MRTLEAVKTSQWPPIFLTLALHFFEYCYAVDGHGINGQAYSQAGSSLTDELEVVVLQVRNGYCPHVARDAAVCDLGALCF